MCWATSCAAISLIIAAYLTAGMGFVLFSVPLLIHYRRQCPDREIGVGWKGAVTLLIFLLLSWPLWLVYWSRWTWAELQHRNDVP